METRWSRGVRESQEAGSGSPVAREELAAHSPGMQARRAQPAPRLTLSGGGHLEGCSLPTLECPFGRSACLDSAAGLRFQLEIRSAIPPKTASSRTTPTEILCLHPGRVEKNGREWIEIEKSDDLERRHEIILGPDVVSEGNEHPQENPATT